MDDFFVGVVEVVVFVGFVDELVVEFFEVVVELCVVVDVDLLVEFGEGDGVVG